MYPHCRSCILPIGLLFAATLWLGNAAYLYLSVSFIQMLKASMPMAVRSWLIAHVLLLCSSGLIGHFGLLCVPSSTPCQMNSHAHGVVVLLYVAALWVPAPAATVSCIQMFKGWMLVQRTSQHDDIDISLTLLYR